jgi:hypothetical protein
MTSPRSDSRLWNSRPSTAFSSYWAVQDLADKPVFAVRDRQQELQETLEQDLWVRRVDEIRVRLGDGLQKLAIAALFVHALPHCRAVSEFFAVIAATHSVA